jgi:hypothetical protein
MKKTLLTTTAIAGLLISGAAVAQTTVSGNLNLAYKGVSTSNAKDKSFRGFGKESQINVSNKGKLSNGMDYVAGFSIEHDGQELTTAATTSGGAMFNENVYIDFISGNTTLTIGADHIQNPDYEITNLTGVVDLDDAISGVNFGTPAFSAAAGSPYSAFGFGVTQNVGIGRLSAYYAPSGAAIAGSDDTGFAATASSYVDGANSLYELGFRGDLGVKGLDAGLWYNNSASNDKGSSSSGLGNYKTTLRYNAGVVTVAGSYVVQEALTGAGATATITEKETKTIGASFAASKDVSVGIAHGRTSDNASAAKKAADEKITSISLGYSLGPVGLGVAVSKVDNIGNTNEADGKTALFIAKTTF